MAVMARSLRVAVAGGWYHVTARGNERQRGQLLKRDIGARMEQCGRNGARP